MKKGFEKDLISIVIPVYNAAPYLNETIRAIEKQTYPNWELIFVDDASTDDSLQILQDYKMHHKGSQRIEVISFSENQGPAAARNAGVKAARGRYLVFQDADDIWDKDKLEKQLGFMQKKQYAFSFTGYEFADETATRSGKIVSVPKEIRYEEALKNTTISTITVMFDREQIPSELLVMPENCQREDTATWWKILKHGYVAYGLDEPLSVYRRHAGSHSSNKWNAVKGTWKMYRIQEKMPVPKAAYYMTFNLMNAVKRRL